MVAQAIFITVLFYLGRWFMTAGIPSGGSSVRVEGKTVGNEDSLKKVALKMDGAVQKIQRRELQIPWG